MFLKVLFSILIILTGITSNPTEDTNGSIPNKIGCLKCHTIDKNKINVHLVPHSHDDVGWVKTVDEYYEQVRRIINSVVEELPINPDRRYIQVETAFFSKWWNTQPDELKKKFKSLVDNGQIEMVNGAWSMNDEACSNYQSIIDQFSWGLRAINEALGTCGIPRVGWQIDTFGHSREQASLFVQLGFDGVFFARLDHNDKKKRRQDKTLDFIWQGSANIDTNPLFGGIFPTALYNPPEGYCFDQACSNPVINNNPKNRKYNLNTKVKGFEMFIGHYIEWYPTKNILIPMGGDFHFENAKKNYINIDKLILAFKNNSEINLIYSTPSCYIKAVNSYGPTLKLKTDDFFPYSNNNHTFWVGYFTSRPNFKRFERVGHNILQVAKQLVAINGVTERNNKHINSLEYLREAMGIIQHHDAITGTEKQHVANDYIRILTRGIKYAEKPLGEIISNLLKTNETSGLHLNISSCLLSNISICHVSQNSEKFIVVVYNPLAWPVNQHVRLPVKSDKFDIQGPDGKEIYDVVHSISNFNFVTVKSETPSILQLVFLAKKIPPMGIKMYYITKTKIPADFYPVHSNNLKFGNNQTSFEMDESTKLLKKVTVNGITLNITQNFYYYVSETGENSNTHRPSGAYIFHPTRSSAASFQSKVIITNTIRGKLVEECQQKWIDGDVDISQIIRVYKDQNYIEFDWLIGRINVRRMGKEVISRFTVSNFDNNHTFYTDSNGREMMKRILNSRPDYTYDATIDPVASNYYPVTSKIVIKDWMKNLELAILNDRAQGGSSLANGDIEFMVHRRILTDDWKGMDEGLNEIEFKRGVYVRGSHYLLFGPAGSPNSDGRSTGAQERILYQKKLVQPWVGIGDATSDSLSYDTVKQKLNFEYSALNQALPENINILTFEPWRNDTVLLRLEHILEKDEDPVLSNTVSVNISKLFKKFEIVHITETTLGANQKLEDYKKIPKYKWKISGTKMPVVPAVDDDNSVKFINVNNSISLTPMQIRTFVVKIRLKEN